ncbi:MAG: hypothetical protein LBL46_00120 [Rickettsiales bacterium]|nr:hypothetical protein [Rickettsiales bacterium]
MVKKSASAVGRRILLSAEARKGEGGFRITSSYREIEMNKLVLRNKYNTKM